MVDRESLLDKMASNFEYSEAEEEIDDGLGEIEGKLQAKGYHKQKYTHFITDGDGDEHEGKIYVGKIVVRQFKDEEGFTETKYNLPILFASAMGDKSYFKKQINLKNLKKDSTTIVEHLSKKSHLFVIYQSIMRCAGKKISKKANCLKNIDLRQLKALIHGCTVSLNVFKAGTLPNGNDYYFIRFTDIDFDSASINKSQKAKKESKNIDKAEIESEDSDDIEIYYVNDESNAEYENAEKESDDELDI
jgi:hypothetical protein